MTDNSRIARTLRLSALSSIVVAIGLCLATGGAFAATDDQPCASNPENRQLDYWLGNWAMGSCTDKSPTTVSLSMGKCVRLTLAVWKRARYGKDVCLQPRGKEL